MGEEIKLSLCRKPQRIDKNFLRLISYCNEITRFKAKYGQITIIYTSNKLWEFEIKHIPLTIESE